MKRLISTISAVFLLSGMTMAQAVIKFMEESHDFGEVIEGKLASYEFEIMNTGNQPLIVNNVQASCGCTSPFWTKEPIMPGKTGKIKATYNSAGRPGQFNKSLTVVSNGATGSKMLYIKGTVIKKEDKVYSEEQKKNSAKLIVEKSTFNVGKLEVGQKGIAKISITNKGIDPLEIDNVTSPCGCTTFSMNKGSIKSGETGILEVTITPKEKGSLKEEISISSSDVNTPNFRIYLTGDVIESFTPSNMKEGANTNMFK